MSGEGNGGMNLGAAAQWVGIVAVLLGQVHQCRTEDKESTKTSVQVGEMAGRVVKLEEGSMQLGRIEERQKALDDRFGRFERFVEQQFRDLKEKKR